MPNNNPTLLTITGDVKVLQRFMSDVKSDENPLEFENIYPIPEGADWYSWCNRYWGTKWGAYDVEDWIKISDNMWTIFYYTANAPATRFYLHISIRYPDIVFKQEFADEGGNYVGFNMIQNGNILNNVGMDWKSDEAIALRMKLGMYD
ncbi:MAG TPA: hypothetical protein VLG50_06525 [Candidatus Saccharimonadales bacterium]|nr:hypothetical protein [Candidatus Saccharimonadales bacterium]